MRRQFWPTMRPAYAGYLAWRGLIPEDDMPLAARETLHGDFGFANNEGSHILGYLCPRRAERLPALATDSTTGFGTVWRMNGNARRDAD